MICQNRPLVTLEAEIQVKRKRTRVKTQWQCLLPEPPVRIISPSQPQMELCQQTSERMVLSCEISRPNAQVRWYRDGLEVEENDNLILEVDGVYRRLIIPETTVKDSAEYVCDTADDSMTFFVNIAGKTEVKRGRSK